MSIGRTPGLLIGLLDAFERTPIPKGGTQKPIPLGHDGGTVSGPSLVGWPRKIAWSEFNPVERPSGETEDAQIDTQTQQPSQVGVKHEQGKIRLEDFKVTLAVIPNSSWVVADQKNDALLAHEQGHFDITGLVARDLVKALGALRASKKDDLQREVSRLFKTHDGRAKSLSEQYDEETNHGRNAEKQSEWQSRIEACIKNGTRLRTRPR